MQFTGSKMLASMILVVSVAVFWFSSIAYAGGCSSHGSSAACGSNNDSGHNHGDTAQSKQASTMCSSDIPEEYSFLKNMPIFIDSPEAIYAKGIQLNLTSEQLAKISAICHQARKDAVAVLTADQKAKLGTVSDQPITFAKICPMMKMDSGEHAGHAVQNTPAKSENPTELAKVAEQTTCPVMGGKINKEISTTYKGKTVYFCCPGCIDKFTKDPNAYIGKLPQFAK